MKRFSQFDVANRALLDRKRFDALRRPIGLGDMARVRRRWLTWPRLGRRWVRMTIFLSIGFTAMIALVMFQATPQLGTFLARGIAIGAYLFALSFLLFPPDSRMVALSRQRTHPARHPDQAVVMARREAWITMLRSDKDRARLTRWGRHPSINGLMLVGFITAFTLIFLSDMVRGPANSIPFGRMALTFFFPVCLWVTIGVSKWYTRRLRARFADRLQSNQCCDCGYQLDLGEKGLGPPRCLECGCPWPLVPPELPPSPAPSGFFQLPASMR